MLPTPAPNCCLRIASRCTQADPYLARVLKKYVTGGQSPAQLLQFRPYFAKRFGHFVKSNTGWKCSSASISSHVMSQAWETLKHDNQQTCLKLSDIQYPLCFSHHIPLPKLPTLKAKTYEPQNIASRASKNLLGDLSSTCNRSWWPWRRCVGNVQEKLLGLSKTWLAILKYGALHKWRYPMDDLYWVFLNGWFRGNIKPGLTNPKQLFNQGCTI